MCARTRKLDESVYVCNEYIWETGGESVMDERVCVRETEACDKHVRERVTSSDKNVKFPYVKM